MPQCVTWDETKGLTERLIALQKSPENFSYSEIAEKLAQEFHFQLTRNSCIAKARRLNLPGRAPRVNSSRQERFRQLADKFVDNIVAAPSQHQ